MYPHPLDRWGRNRMSRRGAPPKPLTESNQMIEQFLAATEDMSESDRNDVVWGYLPVEGFTYVTDIEKDEHRWYMITWSIFEQDGRYLAVSWERGLTESQENYVTFDTDHVFEVAVFEKIVVDYKSI